MFEKRKIECFFGDRYEFYSKGSYNENGEYLGRIWDNKLDHWVPERFKKRHSKVQVTSRVVFDKVCALRMNDGKQKKLYVSRLIYQAFHPEWGMFDNPRQHPINHINEEDTCNNDLDNLELSTPKENSNYGTRTQRQAESVRIQRRTSTAYNRSKPCVCIGLNQYFWSSYEASEAIGHPGMSAPIRMCCRGIQQTAYGYTWRYATEEEIQQHS